MTNMLEKGLWWMYWQLHIKPPSRHNELKARQVWVSLENLIMNKAVNSLQLPLWETRASDHTEFLNLIKWFSRTIQKYGSVSGMLGGEESSLWQVPGLWLWGEYFTKRQNKPEQWDYGSARVSMSILSHLGKLCNNKEKQTHLTCFVLLLVGI